jgi:hypothetical protein
VVVLADDAEAVCDACFVTVFPFNCGAICLDFVPVDELLAVFGFFLSILRMQIDYFSYIHCRGIFSEKSGCYVDHNRCYLKEKYYSFFGDFFASHYRSIFI